MIRSTLSTTFSLLGDATRVISSGANACTNLFTEVSQSSRIRQAKMDELEQKGPDNWTPADVLFFNQNK